MEGTTEANLIGLQGHAATQQDVEQTSAGPDVLLGPTLLQLRLQALVVSPPWRCRKVAKLVAGGGEDAGQSQVRDNDMGRRGRIRDGGQAHAVHPQVTVDNAPRLLLMTETQRFQNLTHHL